MRLTAIAVVAGVALTMGACSDATGPTALLGEYDLTRYNQTDVPLVIHSDPCDQYVDAGTLSLRPDRSWAVSLTIRMSCPSGSPPQAPVVIRYHGTYVFRAAGAALVMQGTPDTLPLVVQDGERVDLDLRPYFGAPTEYMRHH